MAGRIPQSFIADLLARVDIVDVIDAQVPLRQAGRNHQALCPFHDEKTPSFSVNRDKQFYHCFGCGAGGNVISFLMEYGGMSFVEAVEDLARRCGMTIPREAGYQPQAGRRDELCELLEQVARFYQGQLREHGAARDYLAKRGLGAEIIGKYEIGYVPPGWKNLCNALGQSAETRARLEEAGMIKHGDGDSCYDFFRARIMFPIRDQRGRVIGFGGRVLDDSDAKAPKYLNSPETPVYRKSDELYGLHHLARNKPQRIYVVEGYMDVVALAQHGVANAVAALGTAATKQHLEKLYRVAGQVVFCFDGDAAGRKAAWRALETALPLLREGRQALFSFMPAGHDPDSFVRERGAEAFCADERVVTCSDFLLDSLKSRVDLATREGRAGLLDSALPYLARMPASGLRHLLTRDLAGLAQTDAAQVEGLLHGRRKPPGAPPRAAPKQPGKNLAGAVISCLLSKPQLALSQNPAELADIPVKGADFVVQLIDLIHANPEINCAGILEHWRGSAYERRLTELAAEVLPESDDFNAERQFSDAMKKLKAARERKSIAEIARLKPSELSAEDRERLRRRYSEAGAAADPPQD